MPYVVTSKCWQEMHEAKVHRKEREEETRREPDFKKEMIRRQRKRQKSSRNRQRRSPKQAEKAARQAEMTARQAEKAQQAANKTSRLCPVRRLRKR